MPLVGAGEETAAARGNPSAAPSPAGGLPVFCGSGRPPSSSERPIFPTFGRSKEGGLPVRSLPPPPQLLLPDRSLRGPSEHPTGGRLLRSPPCRASRGTGQQKGREGQRGQAGSWCLPACQGREAVARCSKHRGAHFSLGLRRAKRAACQPAPVRGSPIGCPRQQQDERRCIKGPLAGAGRPPLHAETPTATIGPPRHEIARVPGLDAAAGPECDADQQIPMASVPCGSR